MTRTLYRFLLGMHPASFQQEFSEEMLWIFDQAALHDGIASLFLDGLVSVMRQWVMRSGLWKVVIAGICGFLYVAMFLGSIGALPRS